MGAKGKQGETRGDKTLYRKAETQSNTGTHVGRQWKTRGDKTRVIQNRHTCGHTIKKRGDKTSRRRTHHPTQLHIWGENGKQGDGRDLEKADAPSNTGTHMGRQGETRPRKGGDPIQQKETRRETRGDNTWRRRTHHPTKASKKRNNGRQGETKGDKTSGRQTHHPTKGTKKGDTSARRTAIQQITGRETMGDKGRQDLDKADTPSNKRKDKRRQDLGKADTPSNKRKQEEKQWETRGGKTSGRRTHHSTQAHMWGDNGKQWDTRGDNGRQCETMGDNGRQGETRCEKRRETMGDKRRQDLEKADTPSNTGARVGRQLTIGNKGPTQAHAGRQWET